MEKRHKAFCDIAIKYNRPINIEVLTWRASKNWYDEMNISAEQRAKIPQTCVNFAKRMVEYVNQNSIGGAYGIVAGTVGPMSDAYTHDSTSSFEQAREYHKETVKSIKDTGLDSFLAATMTGSTEASAISAAAVEQGMKCYISFTLGSDGKLPSGETLKEAIEKVDSIAAPEYFEINCSHPIYIKPILTKGIENREKWVKRIQGIRANGSSKTHEELDRSDNLDEGNPKQWAKELKELCDISSAIKLLGGCCGTGPIHCEEIAKLLD